MIKGIGLRYKGYGSTHYITYTIEVRGNLILSTVASGERERLEKTCAYVH